MPGPEAIRGALTSALQRRIAQVDPAIVVSNVSTLDDVVLDAAAQPRLRTLLTAGLASSRSRSQRSDCIGVISRSVTQRTNEIGIRMALGASSVNIITMVLREGMTMAATGVALGIAISYAAARMLTALLFGITPTDAVSFALASGCLLLFALIASYLPARKATRIDPAVSLRAE